MMNALLLANGCITLWSHKTEALMQNKTVNICLLIVNEIGKYFFFFVDILRQAKTFAIWQTTGNSKTI